MLLAIFGPLLLIPIIWITYRLITKKFIHQIYKDKYEQTTNDLIAIAITTIVILTLLIISYMPGKMEFDKLCLQYGIPSIKCFSDFATYSASKAAAYSITQGLHDKLKEQGTAVLSVHPGPIATDMVDGLGFDKIAEFNHKTIKK